MQLGIFAKTFPGTGAPALLGAARAAGYDCTQFNMASIGLPAMPDAIPDAVLADLGAAAAESGVAIVALSGTYNIIHPDPTVRADGLRRLGVMLTAARRLGVGLVTLCTGTRDALDQWRHHPDNATPSAWADLCREMAQAVAMAEAAGVDLGIEPEQANVVTSAADAKRLISEMGSARVRIVLDPANLFELADQTGARTVVAEAIDLLGGRIAMVHAKDRADDGTFTTVGKGVVDFPDFVARLRAAGFAGPMVTHGLTAEEAPGVASYLRGLISR
ncbi:MAG: sugar phosphate isomerase/epimerase family protein [Geminicoccaceae bacterium]